MVHKAQYYGQYMNTKPVSQNLVLLSWDHNMIPINEIEHKWAKWIEEFRKTNTVIPSIKK